MSVFTSKTITIGTPAEAIADKFSDLSRLQDLVDKVPEAQRAQLGQVSFTPDSIVLHTAQVGDVTLKLTERTPERIALTAVGSPVPMNLYINLKALSPEQTEMSTSMDVELPAFAKALVGPTMQKAVDQFGDQFGNLLQHMA